MGGESLPANGDGGLLLEKPLPEAELVGDSVNRFLLRLHAHESVVDTPELVRCMTADPRAGRCRRRDSYRLMMASAIGFHEVVAVATRDEDVQTL